MNIIDRTIAFFAPSWAVSRLTARATLQQISNLLGSKSGYDAAKVNTNTKDRQPGEAKEFSIPREEVWRLRWQSWGLWRNNPYARKIVRSLQSKVIGRGLNPESLAVNEDGSPNVEFRTRAKELWLSLQSGFDIRGLPGRGGLTMSGLQKMAFRAVILSGDTLARLVPIEPLDQTQRNIPIRMALQIIDSARLADTNLPPEAIRDTGNTIYRGVELDQNGKRVAYWVNDYLPGAVTAQYGTAKSIAAEQIIHLFVEDDIDQIRGTPWFASALLSVRDTGDLQYNVLKASAMQACIVLGYRKATGAPRFGLNSSTEHSATSADGSDLTDSDGNAITKIQPGMFVNLGRDGELQGFSPNTQSLNASEFIQHMLRGIAAAFPGVKSSTVTGDYRNASFSSERASDNDTWPEIEDVQEWFASSFCQPIWEAVLRAAVLSGYFDGIVTAEEFQANTGKFTAAHWQGPVSRSINPTDDINSAGLRMKFGLSSLQQECAALNVNWLDVLNNIDELYTIAAEKGIPQEVVNNILGVTSQDVIAQAVSNSQSPNAPADQNTDQNSQQQDQETAVAA